MKNENCTNFVNTLNTIAKKGITTREELLADPLLYTNMFYATERYIKYYVLMSKTHKKKNGVVVNGNLEKVRFITENSSYEREDIEMECLAKVMENIEKAFAKPLNGQAWYIFNICSNVVNDYLREIDLGMVWLDKTVEVHTNSDDKPSTIGEMTPDNTYNPEKTFIDNETIKELTGMLKEKQRNDAELKRNTILQEIEVLSLKPAEVFANLTVHLNMKNRDVCSLLLDKGAVAACDEILNNISREFEIKNINEYVNTASISDKLFKVDSNDPKKVGHQISELRSRAKSKLKLTQKSTTK
ncbi:MAG: hypothetical protein E7571_00230 [Ruminococcaceae bacterium]|nr:hypothetical protein [Oscillospiraceae bacterium]